MASPLLLQPRSKGYGPDETCRLGTCPVSLSVYGYRPSIAANATLLALFAAVLLVQLGLGVRWRAWTFMFCMAWGCITEMIGYSGRIMLWLNPFSFPGFLIQIVCITTGPAFYSAAIYFTLSKIVTYLGAQHSRFSPKLYYWIFIPCDVVSLTLQGTGGGISSSSTGTSNAGVYIAIAGLSFQVFTLTVFVVLAGDYAIRYARGQHSSTKKPEVSARFKVFVGFLCLAIVLILIRCAYRIDELSDGYNGPLIHNQGLFIGLEGVMVIVAAFCLCIAHPGPVFARTRSPAAGDTIVYDGKAET